MSEDASIDNPNPVDYLHSTLHAGTLLKELGFTLAGMTQDAEVWIRKDHGIWHLVIAQIDDPQASVIYKRMRVRAGALTPTETLERKNVPVSDLRRIMLKWTAEAVEVIHCLLDDDPDAFDPRADLERLIPHKCPECGSNNISSEADDEGLLDCFNCGIWFDPLHPNNSPVRNQMEAELEDEIPDLKSYALRHGSKPYGYVLRSQMKDSCYPWMNTRWSDQADCCGNFRRHIGNATVFKRLSTAKGYSSLDAVPVYSDPRMTGDRALSPSGVTESFDPDDPEAFLKRMPVFNPRIRISYSQTTPESAEQGDTSDSGWIDEEGAEMTPDKYDQEEGLTVVDLAVKFLQHEGASEASASYFHPGVWYSTSWHTISYATGTEEERNFHLVDFSEDEERQIYERMHQVWGRTLRR